MLGRLFTRKDDDMAASRLFNEQTFYAQFRQDLEYASQEIVIESPFMTRKRVRSLLPHLVKAIQREVKVVINTRVPAEHDQYFHQECLLVAVELQEIGVKVLFTTGHHRKLALVDRKILWEGSHNILSQNQSCEIMRRIESKALVHQTLKFTGLNKFL